MPPHLRLLCLNPRMRPAPSKIPEVRGLPGLGVAPWILRDAPRFVLEQVERHGTPLRFPMGPLGMTVLSRPEEIRHVLLDRWRDYPRGRAVNLVRPMLGDGLPMADGEGWLRRRRTLQPAFGQARLEQLVPVLVRVAERHASRLVPGSRIRAHDVFMRLTLETVVEAMFSDILDEVSPALSGALHDIEHYVGRYALLPFAVPLGLPTPDNRRFRRAIAVLDAVVYDLIDRRRRRGDVADATGERDLLGALLAARDPETGAALTDRELRDEVLNIFYAGHETTANALTWLTVLLDAHPDVAARLRAELAQVLGGRPPSAVDLPRLPYAGAVVRETLRLYPPAWIFARTAAVDDVISGIAIPAGTVVIISPYVTHRLPDLWPDPLRFDPERFIRDPSLGLGGSKSLAYLPFGAGPHQCIGNQLAVNEVIVALAAILSRFSLRVERPDLVRPRPTATLGVAGGLPVRVEAAPAG